MPYAPADLRPEKSCLVTVVQEAERFPAPVWTFWRREKSLAPVYTGTLHSALQRTELFFQRSSALLAYRQ